MKTPDHTKHDGEPPPVLAGSDARLLSLLDIAVDGIIVIDDHGTVLAYNKACEALFGFPAREVVGKNVSCLMEARHEVAHDRYLRHYLETGERRIIGKGRVVEGRHADGTIIPIELSVGESVSAEGRQFVGILRDLRPRLEEEERLKALQDEMFHLARVTSVDAMGGALAHELNQPLTALILYIQSMERRMARLGGEVPASVQDLMAKIHREAERASQIVQRMRQYVQRRQPSRDLIDVNRAVDEAINLTIMGRRRVARVERRYQPDLPRVAADEVQIQQIVVNLMRNALEAVATHKQPLVEVRTALEAQSVRVAIADNGPGIAPEAQARLFHAFQSGKSDGLGLGLAISRTIAQNHGGDLKVDPGGSGRGATFILELPLSLVAMVEASAS